MDQYKKMYSAIRTTLKTFFMSLDKSDVHKILTWDHVMDEDKLDLFTNFRVILYPLTHPLAKIKNQTLLSFGKYM